MTTSSCVYVLASITEATRCNVMRGTECANKVGYTATTHEQTSELFVRKSALIIFYHLVLPFLLV